jgi:2,3-bisphosphoglycerate-dependent phosphoglycerate mutase
MELLLIRHGLPVRRELVVGVADPELAPEGHAQAQHLADYLAAERIDAVYTSPLLRAQQTAEPVARSQGVTVSIIDDVAEWDRHASAYVPVEELRAANDPRWLALVNKEWAGDESPEQFRARTTSAIESLIDAHPGERIAVVCHGGVINGYLVHVLGLDEPVGFFYPNYTSIHRIAAAQNGARTVVTINETSHLRGSGLPIGMLQ